MVYVTTYEYIKWNYYIKENTHSRLLLHFAKFLLRKVTQIYIPVTSVGVIHFPKLFSKILFNICKLEKKNLFQLGCFDSHYIHIPSFVNYAYSLLIFQWRY